MTPYDLCQGNVRFKGGQTRECFCTFDILCLSAYAMYTSSVYVWYLSKLKMDSSAITILIFN